jgi:hypothetical protein
MKRMISEVDALLRDRERFYGRVADAGFHGRLAWMCLTVFLVTGLCYGGVMGAYRWLHPQFVLSDYRVTGKVFAEAKDSIDANDLSEGNEPVYGRRTDSRMRAVDAKASVDGDVATVVGKVAGVNFDKGIIFVKLGNWPDGMEDIRVCFNLTRPTEAYKVAKLGKDGEYHTITLSEGAILKQAAAWRLPIWTSLKVPALFLANLAVCLFAFYVMNLFIGVDMRFGSMVMVTLLALAATGVMLAVFVPVIAVFAVCTESYHFVKVMHVATFTIAGFFGLRVLAEGLGRLAPPEVPGRRLGVLLSAWLILYMVVGGQLAWMMKPFLGTPYLPATPPFRIESGNIYVNTFRSLARMQIEGMLWAPIVVLVLAYLFIISIKLCFRRRAVPPPIPSVEISE